VLLDVLCGPQVVCLCEWVVGQTAWGCACMDVKDRDGGTWLEVWNMGSLIASHKGPLHIYELVLDPPACVASALPFCETHGL